MWSPRSRFPSLTMGVSGSAEILVCSVPGHSNHDGFSCYRYANGGSPWICERGASHKTQTGGPTFDPSKTKSGYGVGGATASLGSGSGSMPNTAAISYLTTGT